MVLSRDYLVGQQEPLAKSHFQIHFLSIIMSIQVFIPNFTNISMILLSIDLELAGEGNEKLRIYRRCLRFPLQSRRHSSTKQWQTALAWLALSYARLSSLRRPPFATPHHHYSSFHRLCLCCQGNRRGVRGRGKKWESTNHRRSFCKIHHYSPRRHV